MSLQSPAYNNSTYSSGSYSNGSMTSLIRTQSEKSISSSSVVKEGNVKVKEEGGIFKSMVWADRFLVLREFELQFFKNSNANKQAMSIQLRDVLGVERSDTQPLAFEITKAANSSAKGASPPRDGPTKLITCKVETDDEVYSWIDSIYQRCPSMGGVSNPTNFTHRVHVGFDPTSGAFVGLPVEWEKLLTASALTKDDYAKNPKAVLEVLEFYTEKLVKRSEDPQSYPSLTPTPPVSSGSEKQLGYGGGYSGGGNSIAPPRPAPPNSYQRKESYSTSRQNTPPQSGYTTPQYQQDPRIEQQERERRRLQEEEARIQREREIRREREEIAAYNASIPQKKVPMAQQEIGGGSYDYASRDSSPSGQQSRYNPSRPAPSTPSSAKPQQQQPQQQQQQQQQLPALRQMAAQRPAPSAPRQQQNGNGYSTSPQSKVPTSSSQRPPVQPNSRYQDSREQVPQARPANGQTQQQKTYQSSAAPKPLNVAAKPQPSEAVKKAEQALTKKEDAPRKDVRMSSMSESEVMAKLREVVSKDKPLDSYNKQKKIGQGASGSVYVARIRESATSATAKRLLQENGPRAQVAIKQMDLRNQPRKELIVNEIIVMKDSKHPNIVNFLDAFLQEEHSELWVVMEFMEGGALTDVIDNNPSISEDQIATICFEVNIIIVSR